ncbi:spore germination protein [Haloimpatiens sp. FM7315]|uniref:spore germination protein n=1 Tax=Haloimpatiens sp. FM7315 TaxID=3298609 RepID=UPI0035A3B1C8
MDFIGGDSIFGLIGNLKYNTKSNELKNTLEKYKLKKSLSNNINMFKDILKDDDTVVYRKFKNKDSSLDFCLVFINGMTDRKTINESIIYSITEGKLNYCEENFLDELVEKIIIADDVKKTEVVEDLTQNLFYGESILLIEGFDEGIIINTKGWKDRSLSEPLSETIVKGPREGFNESIITNISLVRRKINSTSLKFKFRQLGVRTRTKICIAYVEGIANDKILSELEKRLDGIDIDGIFSTGVIQEFIGDNPLSPFRTVGTTERPDVIAAKLLEGRIAIFCDGSPVVLTVPFLFIEYFQVNEDYYDQYIYASINRILRIIAFIITVSTPSIYVASTVFHKEMIPTKLALSIYLAREGVPLPTVIECIVMLITFEIIREAGIRLPKHFGGAVSMVGALALGESAVNAKLVSAPMVIVVAFTGISGLVLYELKAAIIIIRSSFLLLSSVFGLYGFIFSVMGLLIHLMAIRSFGVPYMLKLTDLNTHNIVDTAIRLPWWYLKYRTKIISKDSIRINGNKGR